MDIKATRAPVYHPCRYQSGGCTIHARRPTECWAFFCEWALGRVPPWMKPDRCGVMAARTTETPALHLWELSPGAARADRIQRFIRKQNREGRHVVVTLHPGTPPADAAELRSQAHLSTGEVRDFAGLHGSVVVPAPAKAPARP